MPFFIHLLNILLNILIIFSGLTILTDNAYGEKLRVGFIKVAPHVIINDQGDASGPAVIYFRAIARKMGIEKIDFIHFPVPRLLSYLKNGKIDAALILTKSSKRELLFLFPKDPLLYIQPAIVVKKSMNMEKITSIDDLLPLKICGWGNAYQSPTMQNPRLNKIFLYGTDTVQDAFNMILRGRADGFYSPGTNTLKYALKKKNYDSKLRILKLPDPQVGLFTAFSKKSGPKYITAYEAALKDIQRSQPYETILNDFFIFFP